MPEVVIVTRASSGIGAATARSLGASGAKVVVNYKSSRDLAEQVVADVNAAGGEACAVGADMGKGGGFRRLVEETDRAFGPLTGRVNKAGRNSSQHRSAQNSAFQDTM